MVHLFSYDVDIGLLFTMRGRLVLTDLESALRFHNFIPNVSDTHFQQSNPLERYNVPNLSARSNSFIMRAIILFLSAFVVAVFTGCGKDRIRGESSLVQGFCATDQVFNPGSGCHTCPQGLTPNQDKSACVSGNIPTAKWVCKSPDTNNGFQITCTPK